ncbi:hypothetical protein HHI36_018345 [Cryptolaemus montrouzieri]|uniref:Uncharacterized protein n=1 Tax=Cryptolaemus montrouzieri TaxID=559131 RepID=A0ABD2NZX4_9CUCU
MHKTYIQELGGTLEQAEVEISPLVSYAGEDLGDRVQGMIFMPFSSTHIQAEDDIRVGKIESLVKQRATAKAALTRFKNRINREDVETDNRVLEGMIRENEILFDKFIEIQDQIDEICEVEDMDAQVEERDSFEMSFFSTVAQARSIIENLSNPSKQRPEVSLPVGDIDPSNQVSSAHSILTKTVRFKFDRDFNKWVKFCDTLEPLIRESEILSQIQKFTFLEHALVGKVSNIIAWLGFSDENYTTEWRKIKSWYEDMKDFIVQPLTGSSSDDFRSLLDTFDNHLPSSKSLKEPTD